VFVIASVLVFATGAIGFWLFARSCRELIGFKNYLSLALLVAWITGIGAQLIEGRFGTGGAKDTGLHNDRMWQAMSALGPDPWDNSGSGTERGAMTAGPVREVDSVASLIGRLESRLETGPDDAKGWALLAQSYAFLGRADEAAAAAERAVALGFDESSLDTRLTAAARDSRAASNWIEQAITR